MAHRTFTHEGIKYIVTHNDLVDGIFILNEIDQMVEVENPSAEVQSQADTLVAEMSSE